MGIPKGDVGAIVRRLAQPGEVVVDVGASDGSITASAAEAVGMSGRVLAFEPDGRYDTWLRMLATYPTVSYFPVAVSDAAGRRALYLGASPQQSSLHAGCVEPAGTTDVVATRLDDLEGPVDVIKVDAQGHEVAIVRGGRRWLNGSTRWIVELWPQGLEAAQTSAQQLCDLFWDAGYVLQAADGRPFERADLAHWLAQVAGTSFINIVALPKAA